VNYVRISSPVLEIQPDNRRQIPAAKALLQGFVWALQETFIFNGST
jgi:hypothetical protein